MEKEVILLPFAEGLLFHLDIIIQNLTHFLLSCSENRATLVKWKTERRHIHADGRSYKGHATFNLKINGKPLKS